MGLKQVPCFSQGIRSEVLKCTWPNGKPSQGQLQEAARKARYNLLHEACKRSQVDVLLTAHHLDDQVELFVIRLSRNSGLAGLAGMPFVSQLYRFEPDPNGNDVIHTVMLVRPLLHFSKNDLYEACKNNTQPWVEDPTNKKLLFLRNLVRGFLNEADYSVLKKEVPGVIVLCQKLRTFFDKGRDISLAEATSIDQNFGYVMIDLGKLKPAEERKQVLYRTLVAVLQFVAQKEKSPRGKVVQTLIDYINSSPPKGALTLAGCNISLAPGSKGSRLLVCASCESKAPASEQSASVVWACNQVNINQSVGPSQQYRMEIVEPAFCLDNSTLETDSLSRFTKCENSLQLLAEAKQAGMLSDVSAAALSKLQGILSLKPRSIDRGNFPKETVEHAGAWGSMQIPCNHACYFMNRFCIAWGEGPKQSSSCEKDLCKLQLVQGCRILSAESSSMHFRKGLLVRYLQEKDWIFLSHCTDQITCVTDTSFTRSNSEDSKTSRSQQRVHVLPCCADGLAESVQGALAKLKNIPLPVRRGLPALVTAEGALISIPSLGLSLCPKIWASSKFCPRVPLGGGPASWL